MKKLLLILLLLPTLAFSKTIELNENNTLILNDRVSSEVTNRILSKARKLDQISGMKNVPIYLVLNTGGGSISAGLQMIEGLKGLSRTIHTITHNAYSMGFETVQSLGDRLMFSHGVLMSHKAAGYVFGEYPGQLDNRLSLQKRRVDLMEEIAVKRTKGKHTLKSYRKIIENEFWCVTPDCLENGFADETVQVKCDSSLQGSHNIHDKFLYENMTIDFIYEYSNCPTQTAPVSETITVDGLTYFTTKNIDTEGLMFNELSPETLTNLKKKLFSRTSDILKYQFTL